MGREHPEVIRIDSDNADAAARANVCHALGQAYDRPDNWPRDLGELLTEAFASSPGAMAELARQLGEILEADREGLPVAHARLFLGPFEVQAPPWASFYLEADQQLMGPVSRYAAEAYAAAGLGPAEAPSDAPDHVTHELEFMYFLAYQEATTDDPIWLVRQQRFWREHLGHWLPKLANAVEAAAADSPFYSRLGKLTRQFCAWGQRQFNNPAGTEPPAS